MLYGLMPRMDKLQEIGQGTDSGTGGILLRSKIRGPILYSALPHVDRTSPVHSIVNDDTGTQHR